MGYNTVADSIDLSSFV